MSPLGDDRNPGTVDRPFVTLARARDEIRRLKASEGLPPGGATVWLHPGDYDLDGTFELTAADGGTEAAPIVYRPFEGDNARIVAGRTVHPSRFAPVTDPALIDRLPANARGHVLRLDLKALGTGSTGPFPDVFRDGGGLLDLYVDGERLPLSRWPNEGYATVARVIDPGAWEGAERRGGTFAYREDRPARWPVDRGVWLDGFWRVPWQSEAMRVARIDTAAKQITFAAPVRDGIGSKYAGPEGSGKEPWYALNLLEEIDRPGEWCVDFPTRVLYVWPPGPLEDAEVLIANDTRPCIVLRDAEHVTLRDLTIEGRLGNGIEIQGGAHNRVAGCTLRHLGGTAVVIRGGTDNGATGCEIHDVGQGGIYLSGGDRATLTACGNYAVNNHIHHYGARKKTYAPAVMVGSYPAGAVGTRVAHNLIHHAPHAAILYGGNDNVIELNEIHDIALDSDDVGALYTWRDWTSWGNVIRHNYIHDAPRAEGVYLDDGDSGDTVVGNVIARTASGAFIGGGHHNVVRNNVFIECPRAVHIDARGVPRGYAGDPRLVEAYRSAPLATEPWRTRYPALKDLWEHRDLPTANVIEWNIALHCPVWLHRPGDEAHFRFLTIGHNLLLPDETGPESGGPLRFTGLGALSDLLREGSPVLGRLPGFEPIPFERIGLYVGDGRRACTEPVEGALPEPAPAVPR